MALVPAYGRDYKSASEARSAYLNGKDFIINDCSSEWNGRYCSCRDYQGETVEIRFARKSACIMVETPFINPDPVPVNPLLQRIING